ncbi:MAG: hypothetical protein JWN07_2911, partial [Hyphomicrobiales bacterium]|nr:hypothetical protein [Hyphomicrobiales bacterium]
LLDAHYVAGDGRANENIGLSSFHEVFHDEHNRLIEQIKDLVRAELAKGDTAFASAWVLPGANLADGIDAVEWNGERLFQAAKFGTETQYQHLVFEEFARKVSPAIHLFGNTNVHLDPAIVSEFANAVYRFGHSMLDENLNTYQLQGEFLDALGNPTDVDTGVRNPLAGTPVLDANGNPVLDQIGLIEAFTNPLQYASMGAEAAGELTLGATHQVGNEIDEFVTGALRNNLLGLPLDLAALNIARGRETGVAPLNLVRNEIYSQTHDSALKPYESWVDFGQSLKHAASLINFVAAYGEHQSLDAATTLVEKRDAALALVLRGSDGFVVSDKAFIDAVTGEATSAATSIKDGVEVANVANPAFATQAQITDAYNFMHSLGAYASIVDHGALAADPRALHDASGAIPTWSTGSVTGLDQIDLWIGGLAEKQNLFGGLLGTTFDFIFRVQMENLQDGDRLYYLPRLEGTHFLSEIENNSFAEMIMHNTGVKHLSASVFLTPEYQVEAAAIDPDDPSTWPVNAETGKLLLQASWVLNADGTHAKGSDGADIKSIKFLGDDNFLGNTMVLGGTEHDDRLTAGNADDDTVYGDGGDDVIDGGDGDDFVYGGDGDDTITDTGGADVIHGDKGNDNINAGIGDDIVFGNDGNDVIHGGKGIDDISGGLGDDIINGDEGDDEILGNEGNDWIEGGQGGDLLNGDQGAPTGQLPLFGGDDVLIGGTWVATDAKGRPTPSEANIQSNNGGDRMQGFSGDDIMVGGGGFNKFEGRKGYDWASFEFDTQGVEVNMTRRDFILDSPPLSPDAIRDVFVETEGLSGSAYNDNLIGTNDAVVDATNEITNVGLIDGLETFFSPNAPVHFSGGNIILGGGGSDRITGGAGGDIIDGDAFLHVELQNSQVVRVIHDGGQKGDVDTAVYSDLAQNYVVGVATADGRGWNGVDAEGFISVVHVVPAVQVGGGGGVAAVVDDGVDKIRNIERLEFLDQTVNLADLVPFSGLTVVNQLPFGSVFIDGVPVIGETLTANASLFDLDPNPFNPQLVTDLRYQWEYLDPARGEWVSITGATASSYVIADFTVGQPIRVVVSFTDGLGFVERVPAVQTAVVTTAPLINTAPFVVPQQGQVGLPDTTIPDVGPVNLFLPVTTVFGDAQTAAASLIYKVTLADGSPLSSIGLSVQDQVATNGALLISGTLLATAPKTFDVRVSATDAGPGTPLTVTDAFTVNVIHPAGVQVVNGSLQDGYIAGATVFMDTNGNGRRESFEAQTTTDGTGHFTLVGKPGALMAIGGNGAVDLATMLPFSGVMKAPVGASVITPLTNLLSEMIDTGMTLASATQALTSAFGLAAGIDVLHIDPIAGTKAGDASAQALFVLGSQVANTLALLHAGVPFADPMTDLANLSAAGLPLDLTSATGVSALVAAAGSFGVFGDQLATLIADSNGLLRDLAGEFTGDQLVAAISAVSAVVQGSEAQALGVAFGDAAMLDVMLHFSGAGLLETVQGGTSGPSGAGSGGQSGSGDTTGSGSTNSGGSTGTGQSGDQSGSQGGGDTTGAGGDNTGSGSTNSGGSTGSGQSGEDHTGSQGGDNTSGGGGSSGGQGGTGLVPSLVTLLQTVSAVQETVDVAGGLKVADVNLVVGTAGEPTLWLEGADANAFEIRSGSAGPELWYAGDAFDFESGHTQFDVWVSAIDPTPTGPSPSSAELRLSVQDVIETPPPAPENVAPVAQGDTYAGNAGQVLVVDAAHGVLANDSDPDGAQLSAVLVAAPTEGAFHFNADGSFTFQPSAAGAFSFTYAANDGALTGNVATVSIEVAAPSGNDGPPPTTNEPPPTTTDTPGQGGSSPGDDQPHCHNRHDYWHNAHLGPDFFMFRHWPNAHKDSDPGEAPAHHDEPVPPNGNTVDFGNMHLHLNDAQAQMLTKLLSYFSTESHHAPSTAETTPAHRDWWSPDDFRHH